MKSAVKFVEWLLRYCYCWPPLWQTGEDNWVVPASHGSAPSNRIWNSTILRSPKQHIWLRTALCGGWCRHMALRNRELHARNDDECVKWDVKPYFRPTIQFYIHVTSKALHNLITSHGWQKKN